MEKSNGRSKLAIAINSMTIESAKLVTISKKKMEINTLKRSLSEKESIILSKLYNYIDEGKIDHQLFIHEFDSINTIKKNIEQLGVDNTAIKSNSKLPLDKITEVSKNLTTGVNDIARKIINKVTKKQV